MAFKTYQEAKSAYFEVDNLRLTIEATVSRAMRVKTISFGDGYNQTQIDGPNSDIERWSIRTAPMSQEETNGLESWLMRTRGAPFSWTPPDATKKFPIRFTTDSYTLGYRNLASVSLADYTSPTNYTVNLNTGVLTRVDVPKDTNVTATVTLAARSYQLQNEWTISQLSGSTYVMSFEIKRVYV
jgi:phage-related protein